ncbi:MAG: transketolase [Lentimicrobium sp.]|nr:transketolase [Lentimicrobium sp.]
MNKINNIESLTETSYRIRMSVLKSLVKAGSGHLGGSLGLADIFTALYFNELNHKPEEPNWEERDRLILSIGHVAPVLYATLAHSGYFNIDELYTLRKLNSRLQGHPGRDKNLPGIETSSGSLGQGLSIAVGMAISAKLDRKAFRVFAILGDGELQEGQIWEAAMSAAHHQLNNLIAIVDRNGLQIDGKTSDVMEIEPLSKKWQAFGWTALECNGHNFTEILNAFETAKSSTDRPVVMIAHTVMGKGIFSIENNHLWHGRVPTINEIADFQCQLDETLKIEIMKHHN